MQLSSISPDAEIILTFNGYGAHLLPGREYRKWMEWFFWAHRARTHFLVGHEKDVGLVKDKRKRPVPCEVDPLGHHPNWRASMVLIKTEAGVDGYDFNYESRPQKLESAFATRLWNGYEKSITRQ